MKKVSFILMIVMFGISQTLLAHMPCCPSHGTKTHHHEHEEKKTATTKKEIKESFYTTVYTCPMHPELQQQQSGKCPKCSMELEKKQVLMTYTCPEKDCEYQKAKHGKCPHHNKELIKSEVKPHCPKCGQPVDEKELKIQKEKISVVKVEQDEIGKKDHCVVMNKDFTVSKKTKVVKYGEQKYYLCCPMCEKAILNQPDKYITTKCTNCAEHIRINELKTKPVKTAQQIETKEQKEKTVYTCPMCGGEFEKPGKCPKCGMDLVPVKH
ncbi:MAG: heavy metal-binding domain-containing protein [Endomicrobiia bacterium]